MEQSGDTAALEHLDADTVFNKLREILCEILVLNHEDIQPSSKLVDDLDADSITFMELTWRIRSDFNLEVPQAKVDEETLTMPLLDGIEKLEKAMGGTTLFEFMQREAARTDYQNPFSVWTGFAGNPEARQQVANTSLSQMAEQMGGSLPAGFNPDAAVATLQMSDLFRFITVDSYVRYIIDLAASQARIHSMGGADAMNSEFIAKLRSEK